MKFIVRAMLSLFAMLIIMFSFFVTTTKKSQILCEKPFFSSVDDFAVSEDGIYTLDSTYHTICKYDLNGDFVFAITYPSTGSGRIFIKDGLLCRYEYRADKVYVYSEDGMVLETIDKDFDELLKEGFLKKNPPSVIERDGKKYSLHNRLILNSELTFDSEVIVVESIWYHIIVCLVVLVMICLFAFAIYNIIRFVMIINGTQENQGHRAFLSRDAGTEKT